jgi:hypothetical protein
MCYTLVVRLLSITLLLVLALSACRPREVAAPPLPSPDATCALIAQHSGWAHALAAAEQRWGTPPFLLLAFIRQESNFRRDARSPKTRGPYGYPQAVARTWETYRQAVQRPRADRNDFAAAVDFVGWYAHDTRTRTGAEYLNVSAHYLAYSRGSAGTGPPSTAARRNAAKVAAFARAYAIDLEACPPH